MNIDILHISKDNDNEITNLTIHWNNDWECGNLDIRYTGDGKFLIDSEYISLERTLKILSKIDLAKLK